MSEEKEATIGSPRSDEDEDPDREMNSMRDKFRNERPPSVTSSPPPSEQPEKRDREDRADSEERESRPRKRDREERKDEFGRIIRDASRERDNIERPRERRDRDPSPSTGLKDKPKEKERSPPGEKEKARDDKDVERDKEKDIKDKDGKDVRDKDIRDRDRERERETRDKERDRDREGRDRDRGDRDREGRDREREGRDREREGRDRDRDGRDRDRGEREYGYGRSHSRERRPPSAPVRDSRERSPPFKRSRRDDLDNPQEWDRPAGGDYGREYYRGDRSFTTPPASYRSGYGDRGAPDPYYPPQERGPSGGRTQPPPPYPHLQRGSGGGGGSAGSSSRATPRSRQVDLYEGPMRTYKQFLETQDDHITPQEAEKKYEEYKVRLSAENKKRQARTFFREHKHEDWFREKYEPAFLEKKKQEKDELGRSNAKAFAAKLAEGNIKFTLEAEAHMEEGEQMEDEEDEATIASTTEGEDTDKDATNPEMEEAGEIGEHANGDAPKEATAEGEAKEGSENQEEKEAKADATTEPEPTSEAEPGSLEPDAEGSTGSSDGPKMISTKPSVQRKNDRLDQALDAQPGQAQPVPTATTQQTAQQIAQQIAQQQQQQQQNRNQRAIEPPRDPNTLFIKTVPPTCSRAELLEVLNRITENEPPPCKLLLSEPMRMKNFHRIGWVTYSSYDLCTKALKELNGYKFRDFELQMTINKPNNTETQTRKFKLAPDYAGSEPRVLHDYEQANELMQLFDKERGIAENPLTTSPDWEPLSTRDKLDRVIYYHRAVHTYCYYCAEQFEDEDDLRRRCGVIHLRGKNKKEPTDTTPSDKATAWAKEVDTKIKERIAKPDNPNEYTGKALMEQVVEELLRENVKKLEEEKYRCAFCSKLFRGDEFVRKHVVLKHPENVTEVRQKAIEEQFFLNYWNDPRHIQPVSSNMQQQMQRSTPHAAARGGHPPGWENASPYRQPAPQPTRVSRGVYQLPRTGSVPLPVPVRINPQARRQENRYTPFPTRRQPVVVAPPPPQSGFHDPRGIREYVDLDAPSEDVPQIDYRTALDT